MNRLVLNADVIMISDTRPSEPRMLWTTCMDDVPEKRKQHVRCIRAHALDHKPDGVSTGAVQCAQDRAAREADAPTCSAILTPALSSSVHVTPCWMKGTDPLPSMATFSTDAKFLRLRMRRGCSDFAAQRLTNIVLTTVLAVTTVMGLLSIVGVGQSYCSIAPCVGPLVVAAGESR